MSIADTAEYQLDALADEINRERRAAKRRIESYGQSDFTNGYLTALSDIAADMGLKTRKDGTVYYS